MRAARLPGSCHAGIRPPAGAARALIFFCQYILQHGFVERQVSHQLFQTGVFFLELFELADLVHFQPDVLLLPPIERLFGNSHSSEQLHQRYSGFCLLQHCDDLFDAESLLLHGKILLFQVQILPKY